MGGVHRAPAARPLPHRRQRHRHDVLRQVPWDSHPENTKLAIGGTLLFIGNARVVTNLILSGMFDRHPDLKMVSVESGVGWVPFILETLDYEMAERRKSSRS